MREIKFRAWDKKDKVVRDVVGMSFYHESVSVDIEHGKYLQDDAKRFELMQFTGLHDRNGTEIYDGDIAEIKSDTVRLATGERNVNGQSIRRVRIGWHEDGCWNKFKNFGNHHTGLTGVFKPEKYYEVIGNIHEDPHLLERD